MFSGIPAWVMNLSAFVVLSLLVYAAWLRIAESFEGTVAHWLAIIICFFIGIALVVEGIKRGSKGARGVEISISAHRLEFSVAGKLFQYELADIEEPSIKFVESMGLSVLAFNVSGGSEVHVPVTLMSLEDRRGLLKALRSGVLTSRIWILPTSRRR